MVTRVTLDADPPALLGHSKDESPAILRVEVRISKNQETLVVFQFYVFFQIVKDVTCVKLLHFGIGSDSRADNLFLF